SEEHTSELQSPCNLVCRLLLEKKNCTLIPLYFTSAAMSWATLQRMKNSPVPVQETATESLSAYVPAPMIGESPTRPYCLFVVPPVDVPAARLPAASSATAPTVPCRVSSSDLIAACGLACRCCSLSNSCCNAFQ